jgi:hypothetical protein
MIQSVASPNISTSCAELGVTGNEDTNTEHDTQIFSVILKKSHMQISIHTQCEIKTDKG